MTNPIRLVLAVHNHQPVGNFDGVFEECYERAYSPFLDVLEDYPELCVSLHTSGSLLEWLIDHRPEYIDRLRLFIERGQIEILGGAFYEPILAGIPSRDRVGQIKAYSQFLTQTFGTEIRGMWVPERVWEQTFASDIVDAGIEFTVLDDFHFRNAGVAEDRMHGYYVTEDEGRLLKIFPGNERLRYLIPFSDPQEIINYARDIADRFPGSVLVFGDDGEKFGGWPQTFDHVYGDQWLRRFFDCLQANSDWLQVTTLGEAVDQVSPLGRCYLPDSSYREMTEWVLDPVRQREYHEVVKRYEHSDDWPQVRQFIRGGFWRNFRVKYSESNEMYVRMLEISQRLEQLEHTTGANREALIEARRELYRGQCNCSYWHGAFGGLYLPHLRNAVYRHLIAADTALDRAEGRTGAWLDAEAADFTLDARQEIRLSSDRLVAYFSPATGGHLYELDIRATRHNLLATLNRRPETYHEIVLAAAGMDPGELGLGDINNAPRFKQEGLDRKIAYDQWPRKSLVDHFLQPGTSLDQFQLGEGRIGDFTSGVYDAVIRRFKGRIELEMTRTGRVGEHEITVAKTVTILPGSSQLDVQYAISGLPADVPFQFAVEFNFAGMAAGQPDRYFYDQRGRQKGPLESVLSLESQSRLGLIDEWLGLDSSLEFSQPAGIWTMPVETISQSEGGFELVHQSSCVMAVWHVVGDPTGCWSVNVLQSVNTSAALARQLSETLPTSAG